MPAAGRMLQFNLPSGHEMRLYATKEFVGTEVGSTNPDLLPDGLKGTAAHWLDHVLCIDVAPTRHGITRGETTYFFDPSGNRNETFTGLGYLGQPDMPVITWTEEELARGIFYHN